MIYFEITFFSTLEMSYHYFDMINGIFIDVKNFIQELNIFKFGLGLIIMNK